MAESIIKELRKRKRLNLIDNLRYIDIYVEYVKKTKNREWSRRQNKFINSIYRSIPKKIKVKPLSFSEFFHYAFCHLYT